MIALIQRVNACTLSIDGSEHAKIGRGLLVLLGISTEDNEDDLCRLSGKICKMRIFSDTEGKMNLSVKDIDGAIMLVSQFTLLADARKGNRPSFIAAARPEQAIPLYEKMIEQIQTDLGKAIAIGVFGADMQINLTNDGPVTIILDSKTK